MKVRAVKNLIYDGDAYKPGAEFDCVGYAFNWLTKQGAIEILGDAESDSADIESVVVVNALPTLDEEKSRKKK